MSTGRLTVTKVSTVCNVFPFFIHLGGAPLATLIVGNIGAAVVAKILTNIYYIIRNIFSFINMTRRQDRLKFVRI